MRAIVAEALVGHYSIAMWFSVELKKRLFQMISFSYSLAVGLSPSSVRAIVAETLVGHYSIAMWFSVELKKRLFQMISFSYSLAVAGSSE